MSHFALRAASVGAAFDLKGFWRLAVVRSPISHLQLDAALCELVLDGSLVRSGGDYYLTHKGYEHIYGRELDKDRGRTGYEEDDLREG